MALDGRTELDSSSHVSDRSLHWASLHSWNLFSNRDRSRAPPETPPARISHCRSLRNCRGDERGGRGLGGSRSYERVRKGGESRAGSRRDTYQRVREGMMLPGVETARRRSFHGRVSEPTDIPASVRSARPSTAIAHHQQLHHHHQHHDHHHHHYHYHHHYHHFPRQLSGDLDHGILLPSASTSGPPELQSLSAPRNTDQERSHNHRISFMSSLRRQHNPRDAAMEARDRLDERLRSAALLSHRHSNVGFPGNLIDEFGLLLDDDDDSWSDDEIWDINIREWLSAWGFEERWHSDFLPPSDHISLSTGLSKAAISRLHKEVFVPRVLTRDKDDGGFKLDSSVQDDCSVCLEHFLAGQLLICLPCKHRFHPDCLTPWLESRGQCPYCRAKVSCEGPCEASSSHSDSAGIVSSSEDDLMTWMEAIDSGLSRLNIR